MACYRQLADDLYAIGASDRRITRFENMIPLPNGLGVSYNSYVVVDEKIVLFDTVDEAVRPVWLDNLLAVLDGRELDYLVLHHVEPDHCAGIIDVLERFPKCKMVANQKVLNLFKQFHDFDPEATDQMMIINEGDELNTGKHVYQFINAPMVHWPEVFVTYDKTAKRLFSADAFGGFKAIAGNMWSDEVKFTEGNWLEEMRRYYINIVGKQGASVMRLLKKASDLEIKEIMPLHGLAYRKPEHIQKVLELYTAWASYEPEETSLVIVYASMYGNMASLAERIAVMLADRGVQDIHMYDISATDAPTIISDLFRASHVIFCGVNYNTNLYYPMNNLLDELAKTNWQNRHYGLVVSKSWGGNADKQLKAHMDGMKNMTQVGETFNILSKFQPEQQEELEAFVDAMKASMDERDNK